MNDYDVPLFGDDDLGITSRPAATRTITAPVAARAHARRTDPTTSHAAAASLGDLRKSQAEVLALFGELPLTDERMIARARRRGVQQSDSGLRSRRAELVALGYLRDSGTKGTTDAGRRTIRWELAP